jgi:hypothetical protein
MNRSRRAFLVAGTLGGAALAAGGWLRYGRSPRLAGPLDDDARGVVGALVPAFLAGALPAGEARAGAIRETVDAVAQAIAGLPPSARHELAQLFGLLAFAPSRIAMTGLWRDWPDASSEDVDAVLARWQASRSTLLRSAYDGLHQLVLAAWYGNARAWPAIGYPGPPPLS